MFGSTRAAIADWDESLTLPTWAGLVAGLLGTAVVLVLVMAMMKLLSIDVWTAAHDTLAAILGVDYVPDTFQILVASMVHLLISAVLGAFFTSMPCCFPRGFWIVSGLIYGILTGAIACFLTGPLMMVFGLSGSVNYFWVMWFNVLYGFLYGLAAATYGLEWALVTRLSHRMSQIIISMPRPY